MQTSSITGPQISRPERAGGRRVAQLRNRPLTVSVFEIMHALKADGLGGADHGVPVRRFEKQAKIEVKRRPAG